MIEAGVRPSGFPPAHTRAPRVHSIQQPSRLRLSTAMNPTHLLKSINEEFTTHVPQEMLLAASSVEERINSVSVTRGLQASKESGHSSPLSGTRTNECQQPPTKDLREPKQLKMAPQREPSKSGPLNESLRSIQSSLFASWGNESSESLG